MSVHGQFPDRLADWWQHEALGQTVFLMSEEAKYNPLYFINALGWFAWPAWPVAGWGVYRLKRGGWDSVKLWMPFGVFVVALIALSLHTGSEQIQAIILLPALALLAGAGLTELKRGAANALLWFSLMLFSFFALVFWVYWAAFDWGWPERLARRLAKLGMETQGLRPLALTLGLMITFTWIAWLVWLRPQPRTPLRPILVWGAGVTFVWCLLLALFMAPLDARLSYVSVAQAINNRAAGASCVASKNLDMTQRQLLAYHTGLEFKPGVSANCNWLLVHQKNRNEDSAGSGWVKRWEGGRPRERNERFSLYQRQG